MRKQNILGSSVWYIFRKKQKSIQLPKLKTWKLWIYLVRESYGKTQIFQRFGFLTYSARLYCAWNRNPYNSDNMGKLNSQSKGNVWENTNIPKLCFLHISCEALNHTIPKIWKKWIPIVRKKYSKKQTFQS